MESIVSKRLRLARESAGFTQIQVKSHTNINNKTLSGYEKGVSEPDLETLKTLAKLYKTSTDYLTGNINDPRPISEISQQPDFSHAFQASNLGDAIVRIVNICAEFNLSNDVMFEMIRKARDKYGLPGGAGGVAAHGPNYPGSGVLDNEK